MLVRAKDWLFLEAEILVGSVALVATKTGPKMSSDSHKRSSVVIQHAAYLEALGSNPVRS